MLDNGKRSNFEYKTVVTRWKSGKMVGQSSVGLFLLDSIFHPRNERATLGPFLFLDLLKYHLLNFHTEEHLPILWKSVYRFLQTHQEVVCCVPILTPIAHWLHHIKFLPFSLHHRFLQWTLSTSRPRPSMSRWSRRLRWCWFVYWIVSRRAFSNEIIVNTSAAVFFRICWLPIKLLRLKLHVAFHFSSIQSTFKKSNVLNLLYWDFILLGDKPGSPDLFAFILLSYAQKLSLRCFHLFFTFLSVK